MYCCTTIKSISCLNLSTTFFCLVHSRANSSFPALPLLQGTCYCVTVVVCVAELPSRSELCVDAWPCRWCLGSCYTSPPPRTLSSLNVMKQKAGEARRRASENCLAPRKSLWCSLAHRAESKHVSGLEAQRLPLLDCCTIIVRNMHRKTGTGQFSRRWLGLTRPEILALTLVLSRSLNSQQPPKATCYMVGPLQLALAGQIPGVAGLMGVT